jgi:hypothetical protein
MRLATEEELQRAHNVALWGGLRGRWSHHQQLKHIPVTLKVFLATLSSLAGFGFSSDKAIVELEKQIREERLKSENITQEDQPTTSLYMTHWNLWKDLLYQYRYPIIGKLTTETLYNLQFVFLCLI